MIPSPHQHCNLIRDAILSLAQFGLHYRDADEPVITNTLQLLLHRRSDKTLLGQPNTHTIVDTNSPFTIHGDVLEHTPYSHNQELHQWLTSTPPTYPHIAYDDIAPPPLLYEVDEIDDTITQAANTYNNDLIHYPVFAEWHTTRSQHPTLHPSYPLDAPPSEWNIYSPEQSHHSTLGRNITTFRESIRLQPTSHHTTHSLTPGSLALTDSEILDILDEYQSPLVLTIDGSFKPSPTLHVYPPRQPHPPTLSHAAASVTITALNNYHPTQQWMDLPTIPLLSRVQPLPAAYDTTNFTNNTVELLARIMDCELLPADTPAIIIYDSTVVHSQHSALLGHSYINRQRTRSVFSAISRMLTQRLEATSPRLPVGVTLEDHSITCNNDDTPTLMDSIMTYIRTMHPCGKTWLPHKHITVVQQTTYINIKSHQLKSNGYPKYRKDPQS